MSKKTASLPRDNSTSRASAKTEDADMASTKLSPALKALINAPFAKSGHCPSPNAIRDVYARIAQDAARRKLGTRPWVVISAATTITLNSPDSLPVLHSVAAGVSSPGSLSPTASAPAATAELIREVGLKCIAFNGIPRTINCLNAFHAALPASITSQLSTTPTRTPTEAGLGATASRGRALWDSIYAPFDRKLYDKLARAHPDLPVHILHSNYATLLADPADHGSLPSLGRVLTSVVAIACLRAQTGVGPQVLSHVFGLRKAMKDGSYEADGMDAEELAAARWLAGDEGNEWILKTVDDISVALGGSNFAQPRESKL